MHSFAVTAHTTQHLLLRTPVHPVPSITPCSVSMHAAAESVSPILVLAYTHTTNSPPCAALMPADDYSVVAVSSYSPNLDDAKCPGSSTSPLPALNLTTTILRTLNWLLNNYLSPITGQATSCALPVAIPDGKHFEHFVEGRETPAGAYPVTREDMQAAVWLLTGEHTPACGRPFRTPQVQQCPHGPQKLLRACSCACNFDRSVPCSLATNACTVWLCLCWCACCRQPAWK